MLRLISALLLFLTLPTLVIAADKPGDRPNDRRDREDHKDWPRVAAIERAYDHLRVDRTDATWAEFKGKEVGFIPAVGTPELADTERERERGWIIGKLINEGRSPDGLRPGVYYVYVRRHNDQWEAYFCDRETLEPIAKSTEVKQRERNMRKPVFEIDNTTVHLWYLRIAW